MTGTLARVEDAGRAPEHVRREIEEFLQEEAELLDSWQIEEWLKLFTEDGRYWVPANTDDQDPLAEAPIIYDDHSALENRVVRLLSPAVHTQVPRSRTSRVLGNARVRPAADGDWLASARFVLYESRLGRERVLAGRYEYVLMQRDGRWRIRLKKVCLVNNYAPLGFVTILL
jgi:3-phenylpropionate/cinnamic acid dioxygenase small subunit